MVADQIFAGLFGAIVVEDPEPIEASVERVLVVSDIILDGLGNIPAVPAMDRMMGREGELNLVNGQSNPQLSARPGRRERWRIINACVARYLRLRLDGQQLQLLGMDSGRFPQPETVDQLLLTPGNRADLLVTTTTGDSVLRAFYQNRGSMPGMMGPGFGARNPADQRDGAVLATLRVSGEQAASLTVQRTTAERPAVVRVPSAPGSIGFGALFHNEMDEGEDAVFIDSRQGGAQCGRNVLVLGDSDPETAEGPCHQAEVRILMSVKRDPSLSQQDLEQRYGSFFKLDGDPIKESLKQMRRASLYLTVDSKAMPWMLLYKGSNLVETFQISAVSKPTLLAMFSGMAERVRATGADGFLFTAEAWTTWHPGVKRTVHQHKGTFYDVKPDRGEVLLVVAATSDGIRVSLQRHFARDEAGWPVLGRVVSTTRLGPEWRVVVEALNGLPLNSAFRRD